jgi:hypothetical protein
MSEGYCEGGVFKEGEVADIRDEACPTIVCWRLPSFTILQSRLAKVWCRAIVIV